MILSAGLQFQHWPKQTKTTTWPIQAIYANNAVRERCAEQCRMTFQWCTAAVTRTNYSHSTAIVSCQRTVHKVYGWQCWSTSRSLVFIVLFALRVIVVAIVLVFRVALAYLLRGFCEISSLWWRRPLCLWCLVWRAWAIGSRLTFTLNLLSFGVAALTTNTSSFQSYAVFNNYFLIIICYSFLFTITII